MFSSFLGSNPNIQICRKKVHFFVSICCLNVFKMKIKFWIIFPMAFSKKYHFLIFSSSFAFSKYSQTRSTFSNNRVHNFVINCQRTQQINLWPFNLSKQFQLPLKSQSLLPAPIDHYTKKLLQFKCQMHNDGLVLSKHNRFDIKIVAVRRTAFKKDLLSSHNSSRLVNLRKSETQINYYPNNSA